MTSLIRSKLARFVLVAFALQLLVTGGVLLFVRNTTGEFLVEERQELAFELKRELHSAYVAGGHDMLFGLIRTRLSSVPNDSAVILLADPNGKPIAGNLSAWPTVIPVDARWRVIRLYRAGSDKAETMGVVATPLSNGTRLLTGHVIERSVRVSRMVDTAISVGLFVGVSLTLLTAIVLGRILSHQLREIADTADSVREGELAKRVPITGSGDAFDALGVSINAMLDRLSQLMTQLRMITDGLAHDLRSPITRLRAVMDRAVTDAPDERSQIALGRVIDEADKLYAMLSTALLISRTEAGIGSDAIAPQDIGEMLENLAELYEPLAEERGFAIQVNVASRLELAMHRELFSQALGNLIDNALKYAVGGKRIELGVKRAGDDIIVFVADDGAGIPAESRGQAMQRFGRLDPARTHAGAGLGLSLVSAVVQLHSGAIGLEDNEPGLRVVMRFRTPR